MPLTSADVERHVGPRAMRRVRWYEVVDPAREAGELSGRVAGFSVGVDLGPPVSSRCTCLYRTACDHDAVLLMAWVEHPDRFREQRALSVDLPAAPGPLRAWLREYDPELLELGLDELLQHGHWLPRSHPLWRWLDEGLDATLGGLADLPDADRTAAPLHKAIEERVRQRTRQREAMRRASAWRENPPEEPVLRGLWDACREALGPEGLERPPGAFGSVALDAGREALVFRVRSAPGPLEVPVGAQMLDRVSSLHRVEVAGVLLDALFGTVAPEVRGGARDILRTPDWERALRRLDAGLAMAPAPSSEAFGWRVEGAGEVGRVQPVALEPYKTRAGYRTRKLGSTALGDLPSAADRAAFAALKAGAVPALVLEQLIDHPRMVDEDGALVRVRRGALSVALDDAEDGVSIAVLLDGAPVDGPSLQALRAAGERAALRRGPTVLLVGVGPVLAGVAALVADFGGVFPREARGALAARLGMLEGAVPVRIAGALRGRVDPGGVRAVLGLEPLADGALRVEVRVRPLAGGPLFRPGEGPEEVARVVDGQRRFVCRSLRDEPAAVASALAGLPLPPLVEGDGVVDAPDDALDLVRALRGLDAVEVVWTGRIPRVVGELTPAQVQVRALRRHDWFGVEGELSGAPEGLRLADLLAAIRAGRRYVPLDGNGWVRLTMALRDALRPTALLASDEPEPRLSPMAAARAMLELGAGGVRVELPSELVDLDARIRSSDAITPRTPDGLIATLRPYQLDGVTWLRRMAAWAPGAVLADEMGLGKTLQALAFLLDRGGRALVVAPASVNLNWAREAARFAPGLRIALYRGGGREASLDGESDLLITSWELLVRDVDRLAETRFHTVVLDEAQALKNPATRRARAARALDAGFVLALTGTPVENHLLELWSLMRAVAPGLLGPRGQFLERFGSAVLRDAPAGGGNLGRVVRPFLLRRTKAEVAPELPERESSVDWVELAPAERVLYERIRTAAVSAIGSEGERERLAVLAALTRLRQVACAARLVDPDAPAVSSKLARLLERVDAAIDAGEQVLVFSQFTTLLDLAASALEARGIRLVRLDGGTPLAERQARVDRFQAGVADVFLISLKAGGTGLNLTAASTVIHLDPWWNPAAEDQASDRAHRIGQTRRVRIVRLVSAATVEEEVLRLHDEKRALAASVLDGAADAHHLRAADLLALLGGPSADQPTT